MMLSILLPAYKSLVSAIPSFISLETSFVLRACLTAALGEVKVTNSRCEVNTHADFRVNAPIQKKSLLYNKIKPFSF